MSWTKEETVVKEAEKKPRGQRGPGGICQAAKRSHRNVGKSASTLGLSLQRVDAQPASCPASWPTRVKAGQVTPHVSVLRKGMKCPGTGRL